MYLCNFNTLLLLFLLTFISCNNRDEKKPETDPAQFKESLIKVNKITSEDKSVEIDRYAERHGLSVAKTGSGLRYVIYFNGSGIRAASGDTVKIRYEVQLLDGTICYTGDKDIVIGFSDMESGLQEGLLRMREGDKAKFILPPHLAHGLAGDGNKIPPRSAIVYDVELLSVK